MLRCVHTSCRASPGGGNLVTPQSCPFLALSSAVSQPLKQESFKASVLGALNKHNPQGCTKDQLGQSSAIYFAYKTPSRRPTHPRFAGCNWTPLSTVGDRYFSQQQGQIASIPGLGELPPLLAIGQTQCSGHSWESRMTKSSYARTWHIRAMPQNSHFVQPGEPWGKRQQVQVCCTMESSYLPSS